MNGQGYFVFILQRFCSGTKNVLMLKRKEAENPIDYFDKKASSQMASINPHHNILGIS